MPASHDPYTDLDDGTRLYRVLGVPRRAGQAEAFLRLARVLHPDKGGGGPAFAAVRAAYAVLADPRRRAAYDACAADVGLLHPQGGEADLLASLGLACDPATQLVVTCGLCGRPATCTCWVCTLPLCAYCTLRRHWKDDVGAHWPLIDRRHLADRLAQREMERKKEEDAAAADAAAPHYRAQAALDELRDFREAAAAAAAGGEVGAQHALLHAGTPDPALGKYYAWDQTETLVFVAVHVPAGYSDRVLDVVCDGSRLTVQAEGNPAVLRRRLAGVLDSTRPVDVLRTDDNRTALLTLAKARPTPWARLFDGDTDGARCATPVYSLAEADAGVSLSVPVPWWVRADDVSVAVTPDALTLAVAGVLQVTRAFWAGDGRAATGATWTLGDGVGGRRVLTVDVARPPPTSDEMQWKRGVRADNRAQPRRHGPHGALGVRFFACDEDEFGLEDVLAGAVLHAGGRAVLHAKPWVAGSVDAIVTSPSALPPTGRAVYEALLDRELEGEDGEGGKEGSTA